MKLFLPLLAALAFLSSVVTAQPPREVPELDALNESWLAEREKALRPIDAKYEVALQRLRDRLAKSGDLHSALAVDDLPPLFGPGSMRDLVGSWGCFCCLA